MKTRSLSTLGILFLIAAGFYVAIYIRTRMTGGMDPHLFIHPNNLGNLLGQASIVGILACGMTLVIVAGQIDLSVGSLMGMLAAVNAYLLASDRGWNLDWPAPVTLIVTLGFGMALGGAQGAAVAFLRVPSFVVTLGGLMAFRGILILLANQSIPINSPAIQSMGGSSLPWTGALIVAGAIGVFLVALMISRRGGQIRTQGKAGSPFELVAGGVLIAFIVLWLYKGQGEARGGHGLPVRCVIWVALAALFTLISQRLRFGRQVYAIGGNPRAALYSGIAVEWRLVGVFTLMGFCAALAGVVNSGRLMAAGADAGDLMELYAIAACVIGGTSLSGGRGTVFGSMLGALIMATLRNGLSLLNVPNPVEKIVLGVILITAVALDLSFNRGSRGKG